MNDLVARFPRGFLYGLDGVEAPHGFIPAPALPNLYVHPWLSLDSASGSNGEFVLILGLCVSTLSTSPPGSAASILLEDLQQGEDKFLAALDHYSGRFAVFFGGRDGVKVVSDATAMRAVFYAAVGGVVGSHAALVDQALDGEPERDDLPFRTGYPGNRTPFPSVRLLTANTLYDVTAGKVERFWPVREPPAMSVDEAAEILLSRAVTAFRNVAMTRETKVALTAGLDSRTLLAVAFRSGVDFETYTYGWGEDTLMDRNFAVDLAASLGIDHTLVPFEPIAPALSRRLEEAHYNNHHGWAVPSLNNWFKNPMGVATTANLLEIGRSFYKKRQDQGVAPPTTPKSMMSLHYLGMGSPAKRVIEEWGRDRFEAQATAAFRGFINDTDYPTDDSAVLDPFDQFYWEHRMSAWHGTAMVERDFYAEPFIPFNSRPIFEAMLGLPKADRDAGAVQYRAIAQVDKSLLDLPVNPKRWPLEGVESDRAYPPPPVV